MKKRAQVVQLIHVLISVISLLYMRYFESNLYLRSVQGDQYAWTMIYVYIAVPCFYFFFATFIASMLISIFNIRVPVAINKVLTLILMTGVLIFIATIFKNTVDLTPIPLGALYSFAFSGLGAVFALTTARKLLDK